jgi:hypothetical protein
MVLLLPILLITMVLVGLTVVDLMGRREVVSVVLMCVAIAVDDLETKARPVSRC